jgi:hypothetical protein
MNSCPQCGTINYDKAVRCLRCGVDLSPRGSSKVNWWGVALGAVAVVAGLNGCLSAADRKRQHAWMADLSRLENQDPTIHEWFMESYGQDQKDLAPVILVGIGIIVLATRKR